MTLTRTEWETLRDASSAALSTAHDLSGLISDLEPIPEPVYAGHAPGRVLYGMAASEATWDEYAATVGPLFVRRRFYQWDQIGALPGFLSDCARDGHYPVASFKVPANDWAAAAAGSIDVGLDDIAAAAEQSSTPVAVCLHHEPAGDGDPADYAAMQMRAAARLADTPNLAFNPIVNGHWWGPYPRPDDVAAFLPDALLDAVYASGGLVSADCYDAGAGNRTSDKITGFAQWAKAKGLPVVGLGEWGCYDAAELTRCWEIIRDSAVFGYVAYFNSAANSRADWLLTGDRLAAWQTARDESIATG